MKIIVVAIGSRGDVQPYVALCQGLQQAGHQAILATNPTMTALGTAYGVTTAPVGPAVDMGLEGARLWEQSGNQMWLGMIRVMQLASRLIEQAYPDILTLCRDADLVVVSDPTAGSAEAEKLGKPWISVTLQPGRVPPRPDPSPPLSQRLLAPLFWGLGKLLVMPFNRFRRRVGAPSVQDIGRMMSSRLILVPVSPYVVPPDPRWPPQVRQVGYWTARAPETWAPPADLLDFLSAGEPPLAVTLGAMSLVGKRARESAQIVLEAVQQTGGRAIVQGWDEALHDGPLPPTVYRAGSLPHTWLFERVSAVVHHGGFGTTAAALTAGVPGIVVPHIIDQFYWAQQVVALGAGPQFIPRSKLTSMALAAAIREATTDPKLRARAADLSRQIRTGPDGLEAAVRLIETLGQG